MTFVHEDILLVTLGTDKDIKGRKHVQGPAPGCRQGGQKKVLRRFVETMGAAEGRAGRGDMMRVAMKHFGISKSTYINYMKEIRGSTDIE